MVANVPGDLALFSAEDCNIEGSVFYETLVSVPDWNKLETEAPREGPCGGRLLISAARILCRLLLCCGRLRAGWKCTRLAHRCRSLRCLIEVAVTEWAPATNNYRTRASYGFMRAQRTTPVGLFIADLAGELAGEKVEACGCDRYRKSELLDALAAAKLRWSVEWRGKGVVDGSADIRAFQRSVKQRWLRPCRGRLLLTNAISVKRC